MLQSLSMMGAIQEITADDVYSYTGSPSPAALSSYLEILMNKDINTALGELEIAFEGNGISMQSIVK